MKRTRLITLLSLPVAGIAAVASLLIDWHSAPVAAVTSIPVPPELAKKENSAARKEWTRMRLRDPKTGEIPDDIRQRELSFAASIGSADQYRDIFSKPGSASSLQGMEWIGRGPYNIGGRTRALAIDLSDPNTILAGGVSGGMWRSSNGGASWQRTTGLNQLPSVTCVIQDVRPGKTDVWYYGTGEGVGNSVDYEYYGYGLYKSTDRGRTWEAMPSTSGGWLSRFDNLFDIVWNIAIDPSNQAQDELYVAGAGKIARSTDGGESWDEVLGEADTPWGFADVVVTPQGVVYAAIGGFGSDASIGIYRSADGVNWTRITPQFAPDEYGRIGLALAPSNPNVLWILAETPGTGHSGLDGFGEWHSLWRYEYKSGDGSGSGGEWSNRSQNLPQMEGDYGGFRSQGSYNLVIKVKPDNENVVFVGGTNLYRSTNGFTSRSQTTWIGGYKKNAIFFDYDYLNHHPDQHAIAFSPDNPGVMYTGNDGGVQRTDDNLSPTITWTRLNNGYVTSQFYTVAIDHGTPGDNTIIGGLQDNGTWRTISGSGLEPWTNLSGADGGFCYIADGKKAYYASTQGGAAFRGTLNDDGIIQSYTRVDPEGGEGYLFINPFTIDPSDNEVMYYAGGEYLWRNDGLSEIPFSLEPTSVNWIRLEGSYTENQSISAIGVSRANPAHRVYYGTMTGDVYRMDDATAENPRVTPVTGTAFPSYGFVNCIAVDPDNADHAIVVFSNYGVMSLFATTNAGQSWTPVGGNLEENPGGSGDGPSCRWAEMVKRPEGTVYLIGTSTGLYSATELKGNATEWVREGAGTIGSAIIDMIKVRQSDGLVVVATHGNGIFSAYARSSGVDDGRSSVNAELRLEQNVPNPARGVTSIRFHVPGFNGAAVPVRLALFDALGAEVATLVNGPLPPGEQSVSYDCTALPAGSYLYRLSVGRSTAARTMVVTR